MTSPFSSDILDRFWIKVNKSNDPQGCWLWTSVRNLHGRGYGYFGLGKKKTGAHCFSLGLKLGVWPLPKTNDAGEKVEVCHSCVGNPHCVNPDHLRLDTRQSNVADAVRAGRTAAGDRNGARKYKERMVRGDAHWTRTNPEKINTKNRSRGDNHRLRKHPELVLRGASHGMTRWSEAQVLYVRRRWACRDRFPITKTELGREMTPPMSPHNVAYILRPGTWLTAVPKD